MLSGNRSGMPSSSCIFLSVEMTCGCSPVSTPASGDVLVLAIHGQMRGVIMARS